MLVLIFDEGVMAKNLLIVVAAAIYKLYVEILY